MVNNTKTKKQGALILGALILLLIIAANLLLTLINWIL